MLRSFGDQNQAFGISLFLQTAYQ
uniref:Uncharacterized protein n=1 Tax=Arundo donax TaxID=35708 RepID=A0A0A9AVN6_ARUDO